MASSSCHGNKKYLARGVEQVVLGASRCDSDSEFVLWPETTTPARVTSFQRKKETKQPPAKNDTMREYDDAFDDSTLNSLFRSFLPTALCASIIAIRSIINIATNGHPTSPRRWFWGHRSPNGPRTNSSECQSRLAITRRSDAFVGVFRRSRWFVDALSLRRCSCRSMVDGNLG